MESNWRTGSPKPNGQLLGFLIGGGDVVVVGACCCSIAFCSGGSSCTPAGLPLDACSNDANTAGCFLSGGAPGSNAAPACCCCCGGRSTLGSVSSATTSPTAKYA